jgi:hypothetical protein
MIHETKAEQSVGKGITTAGRPWGEKENEQLYFRESNYYSYLAERFKSDAGVLSCYDAKENTFCRGDKQTQKMIDICMTRYRSGGLTPAFFPLYARQ